MLKRRKKQDDVIVSAPSFEDLLSQIAALVEQEMELSKSDDSRHWSLVNLRKALRALGK